MSSEKRIWEDNESLSDQEAILFVMADKPVMDQLGFYREEKLE